MSYKKLRLILGDQLNSYHSWFQQKEPETLYLMAELHQELKYVHHHIQKICAFFLAIEHFSNDLKSQGHHVLHLTLDETKDFETLNELIFHIVEKYKISIFEYQQPDEYRLHCQLWEISKKLTQPRAVSTAQGKNFTTTCVDSEHFMLSFTEIVQYFPTDKSLTMEPFYRKMRQRFDVLMNHDGTPAGNRWNFDSDNRNKLKKSDLAYISAPLMFENDTSKVIKKIKKHNIKVMGNNDKFLLWPVNRNQSLDLLKFFCEVCLPLFGRFQDAMTINSPHHWSLYHSRLSFSLNVKLLSPREVIQAVLEAYDRDERVDLAQTEGFIRQILGWREFIRGIYWINMPEYKSKNALQANLPLPDYFWTGNTKMACMGAAINQSLQKAYAHHIQRLMVTGNFCLLTGIDPDQVDLWYLGIYIDAIEWVELPNTRGMSQYADHGIVATKPYAASGNYINKMSDYCQSCFYDVKDRETELACPFNGFYWQFMLKHRPLFEKNPRINRTYFQWDKTDKNKKEAILERAKINLKKIESL